MRNPEDRSILRRLKRLSQVKPGRESAELAVEHARAALTSLSFSKVSQPPERASTRHRITHLLGGLSIRQRIAVLGGVGAAVVLGLLLFWEGIAPKPLSAMEQMAQRIRQAKSWKFTGITKVTLTPSGNPPKAVKTRREERIIEYWRAPDSIRMETTSDAWKGPQPERTKIAPGGNKPIIMIDNRKKTFCYRPLNKREVEEIRSCSPDKLANYRGEADRELGTKEINGKQARGFVIADKKINPAPRRLPGLLEIWLDSETNLPVLIRHEVKTETLSMTGESSDMQWNIDLDLKLFDATPPAGYTDITPKPPTSDEKVHLIIESLQTYAEASAGRYPQEQHFDIHTWANVIKLLGGGDILPKDTADPQAAARRAIKAFERIPEAKRGKALRALQGFTQIGEIQDYNSDPAYYGQTVRPKDKDKVLLRWKLDDGRYEVIFGDLRAETVTAERLHKLEGK